jgi:pimeloyl-ACP methyl ester carboxylesterase
VSISDALGERRTVEVPAGTIEYRERGAGSPIVFVHGVGVNGDLWRQVAPRLAERHRCIAPDLPLGAHSHALRDGVDMSLPGLARIVQLKAIQRTPTAYGWTTKAPIDPAVMRSYTEHVYRDAGVRRDFARLLRAVDTRYTFEAAEALRGFDKPALLIWAEDDRLFPREHGRRLAELLPQGRFETIPDSRTFIPEEQPERLAAMVGEFADGAG